MEVPKVMYLRLVCVCIMQTRPKMKVVCGGGGGGYVDVVGYVLLLLFFLLSVVATLELLSSGVCTYVYFECSCSVCVCS